MTLAPLIPAAAARADKEFVSAMSVPEALLELLELRDDPPEKRWVSRDLALNRSVVVLTVAAWQAWVETYVSTALTDMIEPPEPESTDPHYQRLLQAGRPLVEIGLLEVKRFSTPNSVQVRRLLRLLGDDPSPRWSFESVGGLRDPADVRGRLNDWVKVRHAIAHGASHLPPVGVLGTTKEGNGSLRHRHANHCVRFFKQLAHTTGHQE